MGNQVWHKQCFKCKTCHRSLDSRTACDGPDKDIYCTECYRSLNLGLDCINCQGLCWEEGHQYKLKDQISELSELRAVMKKKSLIPKQTKNKKNIKMEDADKGVGALYIIMDAIRRRVRERKEEEELVRK